jgi:anti-sigma B factor antagonist
MSTETRSTDFAVNTKKLERATVVELTGEFDIAEVPLAIVELRKALTPESGMVILDVRDLSYIDSAGLAVLASTRAALKQEGRAMVAVGCHGIFEKVLRLTQLDRDIPCFSAVEEAIAFADAA